MIIEIEYLLTLGLTITTGSPLPYLLKTLSATLLVYMYVLGQKSEKARVVFD